VQIEKKREVKRLIVESACKCQKKQIFLDLNFPISLSNLPLYIERGYRGKDSYSKSGIFYIENQSLIAFGAVGNTRLTIKCRNKSCFEELDKLEEAIKEM
jgi:hypothetical protein